MKVLWMYRVSDIPKEKSANKVIRMPCRVDRSGSTVIDEGTLKEASPGTFERFAWMDGRPELDDFRWSFSAIRHPHLPRRDASLVLLQHIPNKSYVDCSGPNPPLMQTAQ